MIGVPIDIDRPDEEVLNDIDHVWQQTRHVPMGGVPDAETVEIMRRAERDALVPTSL
jgi:hypothetical protein